MWLQVNCFDLLLITNTLRKWMPEFGGQVLDFMRFCGINRKSFRLVRMTALQSALQVYSKIAVGCRNAFRLHFICTYFLLICVNSICTVFPWFYSLSFPSVCTWWLGSSDDYLRMIIPIMKWSVWSVIIGDAFASIILRESREKTVLCLTSVCYV